MQEILDLKQELLKGNFDSSIDITLEIETLARQDKINSIGRYLTLIASRLIFIQLSLRLNPQNTYEIRNSLINIQLRNILNDSYYIVEDEQWLKLFQQFFPLALLMAAESGELPPEFDVEKIQNTVDLLLLQTETLSLVRLTYFLDAIQIDKYISNYWRGGLDR